MVEINTVFIALAAVAIGLLFCVVGSGIALYMMRRNQALRIKQFKYKREAIKQKKVQEMQESQQPQAQPQYAAVNTNYALISPSPQSSAQSITPGVIPSTIATPSVTAGPITPHAWEITWQELKVSKQIGQGAYGVVSKGEWRGSEVAIKQMLYTTEKQVAEFKAEVELMMKVRSHPNVIGLLGVCYQPLAIIVEYLSNGSLLYLLRKRDQPPLSVEQNRKILKGVASGMAHLHQEGIVHRDLAARNILLDSSLTPKVSDFGMARVTENEGQTKSEVGPLCWMAPESIYHKVYSPKTDVWSYGVLIWEVLEKGAEPYLPLQPMQAAAEVAEGRLKLKLEQEVDPLLVPIMDMCFSFEANGRPEMDKIREMIAL